MKQNCLKNWKRQQCLKFFAKSLGFAPSNHFSRFTVYRKHPPWKVVPGVIRVEDHKYRTQYGKCNMVATRCADYPVLPHYHVVKTLI